MAAPWDLTVTASCAWPNFSWAETPALTVSRNTWINLPGKKQFCFSYTVRPPSFFSIKRIFGAQHFRVCLKKTVIQKNLDRH
jgi:hypothetical protein